MAVLDAKLAEPIFRQILPSEMGLFACDKVPVRIVCFSVEEFSRPGRHVEPPWLAAIK